MGRMQDAAYLRGEVSARVAGGRTVNECRYRVTDLGLIVWEATRRFYTSFAPPPPGLQAVATDEAQFADRDPKKRRTLVKRKYARAMQKAFRKLQGSRGH